MTSLNFESPSLYRLHGPLAPALFRWEEAEDLPASAPPAPSAPPTDWGLLRSLTQELEGGGEGALLKVAEYFQDRRPWDQAHYALEALRRTPAALWFNQDGLVQGNVGFAQGQTWLPSTKMQVFKPILWEGRGRWLGPVLVHAREDRRAAVGQWAWLRWATSADPDAEAQRERLLRVWDAAPLRDWPDWDKEVRDWATALRHRLAGDPPSPAFYKQHGKLISTLILFSSVKQHTVNLDMAWAEFRASLERAGGPVLPDWAQHSCWAEEAEVTGRFILARLQDQLLWSSQGS